MSEKIKVKVGVRVIAKAREWPNTFIDGYVTEVSTGPVYFENIKVIDENTTVFLVKADRWISADFRGSITKTLTAEVVPYVPQYWDALSCVIRDINEGYERLHSIFKDANREAPDIQKRETILRRMLTQEGYSNLEEVINAGTDKYLAFRKKLFAEYEKAETIIKSVEAKQ